MAWYHLKSNKPFHVSEIFSIFANLKVEINVLLLVRSVETISVEQDESECGSKRSERKALLQRIMVSVLRGGGGGRGRGGRRDSFRLSFPFVCSGPHHSVRANTLQPLVHRIPPRFGMRIFT